MVLFTKEIFLQVKSLTNIHINVSQQPQYPGQPHVPPQWQVFLQGLTSDPANNAGMGVPDFQIYVNCLSKEDAYRVYNELIKQMMDSGSVPELNTKLMDEVLSDKEK